MLCVAVLSFITAHWTLTLGRDRCALAVVGFLPQLSHDEATAGGQRSSPPAVVAEGRAVRSGAQIPMITELGQSVTARSHYLYYY